MLAVKVTDTFDHLTSDKRVRTFIIDDSPIARNRSKEAELLARVSDHSKQNFIKGFNMLTIGWTDGYSFVPVDFSILSSAKETNRKITSLFVLVAFIISVFSFQVFAASNVIPELITY